jgi:hypothetical protein
LQEPPTWQDVIMPLTPDRHFRIPDDEYEPAQDRAEHEGRKLTWIVRHALRLYVAGELPMPSWQSADDESPPAPRQAGSETTDR